MPIRNPDGYLLDGDNEDEYIVASRHGSVPFAAGDDYLIVLPLDLLDPFRQPKTLPDLLKRSQHYVATADWEETIRLAMRMAHQSCYGYAISMAREIMSKYGAASMDEVHRVVDWLHDIYGAIVDLYNQLDGRPYQELTVHRLVNRDALYLHVYPR